MMASRLWFCWTYACAAILFRPVLSDPAVLWSYTLSTEPATFDQALLSCGSGYLTTMATEKEADEILSLVSRTHQSNVTFWVGLKKAQRDCTHSQRPLRGFRWTKTNGEELEGVHWAEEPEATCLQTLCAAVRAEFDGSQLMGRGLISLNCRKRYQFVCKMREGPTGPESSARPATPEPPTTAKTEPGTPGLKLRTRPQPEISQPTPGAKLMLGPGGSEAALGSCKRPIIPEARSLSPDSDSIEVECWSGDRVKLYCRGLPAVWLLPDNSPTNFSSICQRCGPGFQKDASANCVDLDECSSGHALCKHTCLNTEGSYRCVCPDNAGQDQEACTQSVAVEDDGPLAGILVPALIAVGILVALVVVVVVTVKCCLMRKSKKMKMVEKNKHSKASERTD